MPTAKVTKEFKFSSDGIKVDLVPVGAIVDGRAAEVALQSGWGEALSEEAASPRPVSPPPAPEEEKPKARESPLTKAFSRSPRDKGH